MLLSLESIIFKRNLLGNLTSLAMKVVFFLMKILFNPKEVTRLS